MSTTPKDFTWAARPRLILCRRQNPAENRAQLLTESFETATPIVYL